MGVRPDKDRALPGGTLPNDKALIKALGERFIERRDVKAQQFPNRWEPVREPWKMSDFTTHLAGQKTFGHYLVSPEGKCKLFAFDIDLTKTGKWTDEEGQVHQIEPRVVFLKRKDPALTDLRTHLRCMAEGLAIRANRMLDTPVAVATSGGKGLHVYAFTGSLSAAEQRGMALEVLESFGCFEPARGEHFWRHVADYKNLEIEVFPKQATLEGKDLGNLMALPLGIHQKTKGRKHFISLTNGYSEPWIEMDAMQALGGKVPWEKM
jgi:hypothetical protein